MSANPQDLYTVNDGVAQLTFPESVDRLEITLGECRLLLHADGRVEVDSRMIVNKGMVSPGPRTL